MTSDLRTLGKAMRDAQRAYEIGNMHDYLAMRAAEAAFDRALNDPRAALAEIEKKPKKETMHMNEQINMHVEALTGLLRELCPNQTGDLLAKQVAATVRIAVLNAELEAAREAIDAYDAGPQP